MRSILRPGSLCFDIGAHHGESATRLLAEHCAGSVVSVEAERENHAILCHTHHGNDRVVCIHAAVTAHAGFVQVHRAAAQDGLSTLLPVEWRHLYPDADLQPPQTVVGITLSDLFCEYGEPEYVKVDVEGYEEEVITGMRYTMTPPRYISIEFHGARIDVATNALKMLAGMGYAYAAWREEEPDLHLMPITPIAEVSGDLSRLKPTWGNIMVRR